METKKGKLIPYKNENGEIILETIEQRFTRIFYTEPKQKKEEQEEQEERGRTKRSIKLKPEPEQIKKKKIKRKI
ncbi:hypothetical protein [Providencia rettgeri]|uniref:hypothetical protein n=1 Tax=Providencia rettgeri TaxID=587 RepID=UPI0032DB871C